MEILEEMINKCFNQKEIKNAYIPFFISDIEIIIENDNELLSNFFAEIKKNKGWINKK